MAAYSRLSCIAYGFSVVVFSLILPIAQAIPASNAPSESPKRIAVEIPATNQIYIRAKLNSSDPLWFILDSAATWSILDVDTAKKLGIKSGNGRILDLAQAHTVSTTFANNAELDISGAKVPVPVLAIMPLHFKHAPQIVGLIGSDLFKRFVVEINYQERAITLYEPQLYKYHGRGERLPIEIRDEIPRIAIHLSKGPVHDVTARVSLDTGASQTVFLYAPFVEKHRLLQTTEGTVRVAAGGIGGGSIVRKVRASSVTIGKIVFERPIVDFAPGNVDSQLRDGVIGNGLLNRFKVIMDYSRKQVTLAPTDRMMIPTDFEFFQLRIAKENGTFKLQEVFKDGIAGAAGVESGDTLLTITGRAVAHMSLAELSSMFVCDGRAITVSVRRDTEERTLKIETPRIF